MGASESKLAFKEDIFRLAGEPDIAANDVWWTRFYKLPETADDVYALWSPNDLHSLLSLPDDNRASHISQSSPPRNVETLIYTAVARIDLLLATSVRDDILAIHATQILNCIRILTRLLPYIYESEHLVLWEEKFFWQARKPTWTWNKKYNRRSPLFDGLDPGKEVADTDENKELGRPLGEQLLDLTTQLLFLPGFSIPKKYDANGNADPTITYSIWQSGIGCKQSNGMTKDNERNAMEVLRLLLVLTSRMMYCSPSNVAQTDVKALTYLTTQTSRQLVLSLTCSLLNTVLKYNPASWRVPLDLTVVTKDPKQQLVTYSLQLLLILIIYPVPQDEPNAFRKALSRLHRAEDFQFIQQGLTVVLTQPVGIRHGFLRPNCVKGAPFASEMLILFWELLQCNKRFRSFIVDTDRAHDFMILVLFYAMDAKDDPARQGIVRMSIFILQTLSVEPSFGQRLNKTFRGHESLPGILRIANFHGTYADYLITSIHTILTSTKGRLETIYPALLAVLSNIAPFVQGIERATSSKILDLFSTFAAPQFLLANESNHAMLEASLDIINTILEHQYATNRRFIEVIVRSHGRFEALRDFTVDGALNEISRLAQERKERRADPARPVRRSASIDSVRSPASTRSPNLGNVPEHGAFAIGGDEDDDIETEPLSRTSTPAMDSSTTSFDDVPVQSRSMSEKARGKQPVGHGSFSRATSRTVSTSSLTGAMQQSSNSYFTPSAEWLESWLPHLALHDILLVIATEKQRVRQKVANQQRQRHAVETAPVSSAEEPLVSPLLDQAGVIRLQSFSWSPLALGWYLSMLWGFIYAQDASANRGSNGLWTRTCIRLFNIQSRSESISLRSPKGAVDAVGDS
ncbi:hypothetical protein AMS68_007019 [Peltaster fructicola]|uniref:Uncharacterized protein n=1 Tax=Peltaster fructicola TaxID=286661 RepID=A0A6H0Y3B1_9PEZI|nr:hypothetical protein AMS68_007019 [Peltaster fructicola]